MCYLGEVVNTTDMTWKPTGKYYHISFSTIERCLKRCKLHDTRRVCVLIPNRCRDSSVSIVTELWAPRPKFDSRQGWDFFPPLLHPDRLWGPPCLLSNGYWALSSGAKRSEREANHSPPPRAAVRNEWSYTSTRPHVFMVLIMHKDNFTFTVHWR
jgi:hypothetical protein